MQRKIYFFAISDSGFQVKIASLSRALLLFCGGVFFICLALFGFFVQDYFAVKKEARRIEKLENKIFSQKDEISRQRKQIQYFANEINSIKLKLVDLNNFEKKIRIIADFDNSSTDHQSYFSVGGPLPENLNPIIPLKEQHNTLIREMHEQVKLLEQVSENQKEFFEEIYKHCEEKRNLLASTPSIRPIIEGGWVSSGFGYRISPFTGRREFHNGMDISTKKDEPIIATADGIVKYAGEKGLLGKTIVINHGYGLVSIYGHAHKLLKKRGSRVKRGDIIALVGNTGRSTGPHVHYEILLNGVPVNPKKYILN